MSEISMEPYTDEISMQQSTKDDIVIDVPSHDVKVQMINVGLQKYVSSSDQDSDRRSIYRVEPNLKKAHEPSTFHPKLVSIGPHHNKSDHLKPMEQHKWRFLSIFLNPETSSSSSTSSTNDDHTIIMNQKIQCLVAAMEELEAGARACYSETFDDLGSNEFVMMMILDGCFIIQLLLLFQTSGPSCREGFDDNPIFTSHWTVADLQHDLILFENQLPFTVLERIFMITSSRYDQYSLKELALKFFDSLLPRENNILSYWENDSNPDHLLGLFRSSFLPSYKLGGKSSLLYTRRRQADHHCYPQQFSSSITISSDLVQVPSFIRCATKLKEAGVVFKKTENQDLFKIDFKDGKLYIPYLFIDDHTVPVLLNFVAYEQCNRSSTPYFTQYLMFIECLLKSSKDVEHLQSEGIIDHAMKCNEDVINLFSNLCKEVVRDAGDCYLSGLLKDLNRYTQVKRHRRLAKLKEDYAEWKHRHFRSPWAFLSFLAAIFLLVFTAIQTLFSVLAYVSPRPA